MPEENPNTPDHIAIIMDGNGRWAVQRNKYRTSGHKVGVESVRKTIREASKQNIKYLTLFAFSSENWSRPKKEITILMDLFTRALKKEVPELHKNGIRLEFIGEMSRFSAAMINRMQKVTNLTKNNTNMVLTIAINYGGRWDILQATKKIADAVYSGQIKQSDIDEESYKNYLTMAHIPSPDLLIRTGGELRISNFLLWQLAYTELYFTQTLWPDFDKICLQKAINTYIHRERRFGKTSKQLEDSKQC